MDASLTVEERIESVKAGAVGAIALGLAFAGFSLLHVVGQQTLLAMSEESLIYGVGIEGLVSGAIALLSGFLFGVTYRYIVREDRNPHLKSGAVGAFGLYRGLSQADVGVLLHGNPWLLGLLVGESMIMVAIAQVILDKCIQQQWIRPFGLPASSEEAQPNAAHPQAQNSIQ
jgi:hypothetical protein